MEPGKNLARLFERTWVSPVLAVAFLAVGVSGVLMLFHVRVPGMKGMHEWMGVVLVAAGVIHLVLNWRVFAGYFRRRLAWAGVSIAVVIAVVLLIANAGGGPERGPHREGPPRDVMPAAQP